MQLSILFTTTVLAALVSAQTAPTIPSCATDCITNNLPASCNADPKCICNTPSFIDGISCCVFNACDTADQQAALAYAHGVCDPVGASTLLPASAGCSANSTTTGSGAGSAATASTTSGSGSGTASTTGSGSSSAAPATSASTAGTTSGGAASATSSPAAGDRLAVQGIGAVGAAVLGLAAFL